MKWPVVGLLLMGVAAAGAAAMLVTTLQMGDAVAAQPEEQEVAVLVATRELDALRPISADGVAVEHVPMSEAPEAHLASPVQAVGKLLSVPAIEGQAITPQMLLSDGKGARLAASLPSGKRAVSVSLSDHAGLHELLYPGARVDVLATFPLSRSGGAGTAVSTMLLQGVQVIAVEAETIVPPEEREDGAVDLRSASNESDSSSRRRPKRVTFAVDPPQARALQLATEHGTVSLAMRNPLDAAEGDAEVTLLSEGRLAQLASVLPPSVLAKFDEDLGDDTADAEAEPEAEDAEPNDSSKAEAVPELALGDERELNPGPSLFEEPAPQRAPANERKWDVTIFRGVSSETRTFAHPDGDAPASNTRTAAP